MRPWIISFVVLCGAAAEAQNSDLGLLVGIEFPRGQIVTGLPTTVSGSAGASGQLDYAWQVLQRRVDLYIEVPLVLAGRSSGSISGSTTTSSSGLDVFFTPGARLKFSPQSRVSFYGTLGGGLASFVIARSIVGSTITSAGGRTTTGALGLGAGLDFRLTRLLSLRLEGRDFVTPRGLGGTTGNNHGIVQFGIAFHF